MTREERHTDVNLWYMHAHVHTHTETYTYIHTHEDDFILKNECLSHENEF